MPFELTMKTCLIVSLTWLTVVPVLLSAPVAIPRSSPPDISGPLRVHPMNSRYFADARGRPVYLTGSHTWQSLQDGILPGYTTVTQPCYGVNCQVGTNVFSYIMMCLVQGCVAFLDRPLWQSAGRPDLA